MKHITIFIVFLILIFSISNNIIAQDPYGFHCQVFTNTYANNIISNPFEGWYKPIRTDSINGVALPSNAYFPILVVFVQFKDEPSDPRNTWPMNSAPIYLDSLIADEKNLSGNWWERYNPNTQAISSQWLEISRGRFHAISPEGAFSVVLPKTSQEYWNASGQNITKADSMVHNDIWSSLKQQGLTDWRYYDRWKKNNNGIFEYCELGFGDGYVDMIYKIMKSKIIFSSGAQGFNTLGSNYFRDDTVDVVNNIIINYGAGENGSGLTLQFRSTKEQYIGSLFHEHYHYTTYPIFHTTYSRCSYGLGFDFFYSPYDMIINNYMSPFTAQFGVNNTLGDYSSRNSGNGEIMKVPINPLNENEYFLIVNRRKVSKWDRVMAGDTAVINPYSDESEYGKGVYIYHIKDGIVFPGDVDISPQDLECADGFWEWEPQGYTYARDIPDCYQTPLADWPYMKKKNPLYFNDASELNNYSAYGDGTSLSYRGYNPSKSLVKWWGVGDNNDNTCLLGRDRIYTNNEDIYTNNDNRGDRYDAWNVDYNEIFSPYSSPSTVKWDNEPSGVFIWYHSLNGNTANIKVYKASEYGGNLSLDSILKLTPPSRPMNLQVEITDCIDSRRYPRLTWHHNLEPDMLQSGMRPQKRYKIYRAWSAIEEVPGNFEEIDDLLISASSDYAEYIDYETFAMCENGTPELNYRLRYKVKAVDIYEDISVYSDFASTSTYYLNRGGEGGDAIHNGEIYTYELKQNYPNPFNPVTNIQFQVPSLKFVKLAVYDMLGREVTLLVNEVKNPGKYIVSFDASSLSSGVYFYRMTSGDFSETKKLVLVK